MMIQFTKMVAAGNDFLIVDARRRPLRALSRRWSAVSRALCDRRRGIGADGLLVVEPSRTADVRMRVFNPDGSEAEMCGNGARCVARFVRPSSGSVTIDTLGGVVRARVRGARVQINLRDPSELRLNLRLKANGRVFRAAHINTGVPHVVVPVNDLERLDVDGVGRALRRHQAFAPRGANVDFIHPDRARANRLQVRTYERGVEAETLACGTGVAASAAVYALGQAGRGNGTAPATRIAVETRSGEVLVVSCAVTGAGQTRRVTHLMLEGTAKRIGEGSVSWPLETVR